jgi:hypothetical protein
MLTVEREEKKRKNLHYLSSYRKAMPDCTRDREIYKRVASKLFSTNSEMEFAQLKKKEMEFAVHWSHPASLHHALAAI